MNVFIYVHTCTRVLYVYVYGIHNFKVDADNYTRTRCYNNIHTRSQRSI